MRWHSLVLAELDFIEFQRALARACQREIAAGGSRGYALYDAIEPSNRRRLKRAVTDAACDRETGPSVFHLDSTAYAFLERRVRSIRVA